MEFLDKFVLPQSAEHLHLLHYMALLIFFLFLPYLALVFGSTLLSLYHKRKAAVTGNPNHLRYAKDVIEIGTVNKTAGVILGIIPLFGLVLIYSQLLHKLNAVVIVYFFLAFLFIVAGMIFVFTYRYSFSLKTFFSDVNNKVREESGTEATKESINSYLSGMELLNSNSGFWGAILLFAGSYFIAAGLSLSVFSTDAAAKPTFFTAFASGAVLIKWLYYFAASFAAAGAFILFSFFFWDGGKKGVESEYAAFVRSSGAHTVLFALLAIPILLAVNVLLLPLSALSAPVFGFALAALFLVFIIYHFLYDFLKNNSMKYAGWIFIFVFFFIAFGILSEHSAFTYASKPHSTLLANDYNLKMAALKGVSEAPLMTGLEIFNAKCSACHAFDKKIVGPPYKETLPKYEGKIDALVTFIMNPVKINPNFPAMPGQGLRPKEGRAIAEYILGEYKKY